MAAAPAGSASPSPPPPTSKVHNTSFTLTRLTPLYSFNPARLPHYARELRDIVRGDVLRGVQISTAASDRAKSTLVRSCEWTIESGLLPTEQFDSVMIKIIWEDGSTFTAFMIPNYTMFEHMSLRKRKRDGEDFTSLPLLLTKGPQVVTQQLINYIATRFDVKASEVSLPADLLAECLQGYLELVFRDDASQRTIDRHIRIVELVYAVMEPSKSKVKGALRRITFSLGASDVQELYRRQLPYSYRIDGQVAEDVRVSRKACPRLYRHITVVADTNTDSLCGGAVRCLGENEGFRECGDRWNKVHHQQRISFR